MGLGTCPDLGVQWLQTFGNMVMESKFSNIIILCMFAAGSRAHIDFKGVARVVVMAFLRDFFIGKPGE